MGRIDIRNIDDETMKQIDAQCDKYGISKRVDYIRLLIKLDVLTNIVEIIQSSNKGKVIKEDNKNE